MEDDCMRTEYGHPRPDFRREQWMSLNGTWEFAFGKEGVSPDYSQNIQVPFVYQSEASGIESRGKHDIIWYRREFDLTALRPGKRYLLHFGAVDYYTQVWINGKYVGDHKGGYTPFSFDITKMLQQRNQIIVRVEDRYADTSQIRGKQMWQQQEYGCWYAGYSGIWQSVWLESVPEHYIKNFRITPDIEKKQMEMSVEVSGYDLDTIIYAKVSCRGKELAEISCRCMECRISFSVSVNNPSADMNGIFLWTPETPDLYDIQLELRSKEEMQDIVYTYYGMRTIQRHGDKVLLNNLPYYQKLILNQGYYPGGYITAQSDEDYRRDIRLIKEMGFNGVRMHQKIEDPRFLYWCDVMGLIVWEEMPSLYDFNTEAQLQYIRELFAVVKRDYNHPCIAVWVAYNESWGVFDLFHSKAQQAAVQAAYYYFKSLDQTRLVIGNDGWEHTATDLCTIHDYEQNAETMHEVYRDKHCVTEEVPSKMFPRYIQAQGFTYNGQPVIVSEFAGIAFEKNEGWGYGAGAKNTEEYKERLRSLIAAVRSRDYICGYCITQFTDVEHEQNGLLCFDRTPKLPVEEICQMQSFF